MREEEAEASDARSRRAAAELEAERASLVAVWKELGEARQR